MGLFLATALPAPAQEPVCQPERVMTDRSRITARIPISEIQDDLHSLLTKTSVLRKLDPISFSTTTGAIRVSGALAIPTGKLFARFKSPESPSAAATDVFSFNITFRPSVENKCGQTYLSLEFLRVSLEQNDLLGFFGVVENLVAAVLEDEAVRNYVATFLAKPFGLAPEGAVELLDRREIEVDADKKTVKLRVNFAELAAELSRSSRVSSGAKRVVANPSLLRELAQLRLWGFGPEITRSSGDAGQDYEPGFLIELGRGVPNPELRAFMDKRLADDRAFVQQAIAADLTKYGSPASLLQAASKLVLDAKTKLALKGGAVGLLEQRKITALLAAIEAEVQKGLKADNPLFYGDPEAQVKDLRASMEVRVTSLFDQLARDREMVAQVQAAAGQLRGTEMPFVEQRTSEKTLQEFLHFGNSVEYQGQPVFRDLQLRMAPVADEVSLRGQLHMNIPAWTAGFLDPKVSQGLAGVAGHYLPFRVVSKLVFSPQGEVLFSLQTLWVDLPGTKNAFVIKRGDKTGYFLFDSVEQLLATSVVPNVMGNTTRAKLILDTLKATRPTKRGDFIVLALDLPSSPLYKFIPDQVKDLRFWRVGMHDSMTVGRKFLELAAGGGPVSQSYWQAQQRRVAEQLERFQRGERAPREIPVDVQLRFTMPELKKRIDLMLNAVVPVTERLLTEGRQKKDFAAVIVPSELTVDFPSPTELRPVAALLMEHDKKRKPRGAPDPTVEFELAQLHDIFKLHLKGKSHILNAPQPLRLLVGKDYVCDIEATLHLRLKLVDVRDFTGTFVRTPVYLAQQLFEIETVHGGAKVSGCTIGSIVGWGASKVFGLDDTDFENPRSQKLKAKLLSFIMPYLDNDKGAYLIKKASSGPTEEFYHLNRYVRFFSTKDRFALQLNPRLFSPFIDLQAAHPMDPREGEQETLFNGKRIGLRIDNEPDKNQVSLDASMRPTLSTADERNFAAIVKDAGTILTPLAQAPTAAAYQEVMRKARLRELFLTPMTDNESEDRSVIARLHRLTTAYPYLSRRGNSAVFLSPETLGTGIDTITYAKTLIEIRRFETAAIEKARSLGVLQSLLADVEFRAFFDRYSGKRADGADSVQRERIDPLLATYRERFLPRSQAVLATPADSDWTQDFRAEAAKALQIYNEISR